MLLLASKAILCQGAEAMEDATLPLRSSLDVSVTVAPDRTVSSALHCAMSLCRLPGMWWYWEQLVLLVSLRP